MTELATLEAYGSLTEPATLTIQRLLPGPVERVWAYLTESDLRRQWLASGEMAMTAGAAIELVWRNDDLTSPPGQRPEGSAEEHRMKSQITRLEPLRTLVITWGATGEVSFDLEAKGDDVMLTVTHTRLPGRPGLLNIAAGWHMHLDVLAARLADQKVEPFWDGVARLKAEYDRRLPA